MLVLPAMLMLMLVPISVRSHIDVVDADINVVVHVNTCVSADIHANIDVVFCVSANSKSIAHVEIHRTVNAHVSANPNSLVDVHFRVNDSWPCLC